VTLLGRLDRACQRGGGKSSGDCVPLTLWLGPYL